ncbi:MAG TPA: hypothetical protein VK438_16215 [Xanthobacteraceae bacterium]|nr:hypothetical protein [Xanthobacteraceae bacterium]
MRRVGQASGETPTDASARRAQPRDDALIFVFGRLTQSGSLKRLSAGGATIAVDDSDGIPDDIVLFLPRLGMMFRQCLVTVRREGEVEVSFGTMPQSFRDPLVV